MLLTESIVSQCFGQVLISLLVAEVLPLTKERKYVENQAAMSE